MFYDKEIYKTTYVSSKNPIGQLIQGYKKAELIECDVQPIDEKAIKYTWGEKIESNIQAFMNEELNVKDIVIYKNKAYEVEKAIAWDNYNIYALKSVDKVIL
ncbi:hypothetical protein NNC19_07205 [Clostridium sp. SHJSY1]|uniref:hypothetical protein n=1 Tax=Clostridium sp. SHJSY1 TaxID=2942483 RepID=UPI002876D79C|nr:hypothetical protein [Clostridium sp. SHJSY1]MDS0525461.1 hypothetical protein [Clostridium sp. SHJSY1]